MFKIIELKIFLASELHQTLTVLQDEPFTFQTHPVNRDQINDPLVSHYDCRDCINVRRFSRNRFDVCTTNPYDVANTKVRVDLFIRDKATTVTA